MNFKYDLNDIVAQAIMIKEAVILVEGKDDYQIYQRIVNQIKVTAKVYQINAFENYGPGCQSVIQAIHVLQPKFEEKSEINRIILGVIDRDVRPYRDLFNYEIDYTQLKGLFMLKYYSIETYFATPNNLARLIAKITRQTIKNIPTEAIQFSMTSWKNSLPTLYYICLEALKNACIPDYQSITNYNLTERKVCEEKSKNFLLNKILPKKQELDQFAKTKKLKTSDIQLICKGKWYLFNFIYRVAHQIQKLADACHTNKIPQCSSCKTGNFQDCLYSLKTSYKNDSLRFLYYDILEFIDLEEKKDIVQAFSQLDLSN